LTKKKVYLTPAIVSQTKLMVTARQKTLYVARAMFFATERIASAQTQWFSQHRLRPLRFGSPLSKQGFANPKLVSFWSQPARVRVESGN
jgi:hypothetical protein